jgi:hypothetical protein
MVPLQGQGPIQANLMLEISWPDEVLLQVNERGNFLEVKVPIDFTGALGHLSSIIIHSLDPFAHCQLEISVNLGAGLVFGPKLADHDFICHEAFSIPEINLEKLKAFTRNGKVIPTQEFLELICWDKLITLQQKKPTQTNN